MKLFSHPLTWILACSITACVPAKKYQELNAKYTQADQELNSEKSRANTAEAQLNELKVKQEELEKYKIQLETDTASLGASGRRLQSQYDKINSLNDELLKKYAELQKGSQDENSKLLDELDATRLDLQRREDELKKLEQELTGKSNSLSQLSTELIKREERVNELQDLITKKDEAVKSLKNKISEALTSFKNQGLTVENKNGKVYVSLDAKLLFPSGSTDVDSKGKEALVKLAKVLEEQADVEVLVEGHTDTDKIMSSVTPKNNWELSVLRATAVVEIMLKNSKLDAKKLVAAGRGEFMPLGTDKAKNRRIEIILTPNLDKIFKIINS
ncbi:MAG: OmpA family protein [Bacteroidota bacterium]